VDVIDLRQTYTRSASGRQATAKSSMPSLYRADNDAELLHNLSKRTLGVYERIVTASGYSTSLQKVRGQILSEVIVEYAVVDGARRSLRVGIQLPNVVVRGIALERLPQTGR
jgi:hypothetical protein